jgi:hypothetical protein
MQQKINELLAVPLAQKLLFFNEMLTPSVIRLAYWLCLLAILWTGLGRIFTGGLSGLLGGVAYIAIGAILARMGAELIILLFKLNENIEKVVDNTLPVSASIAVGEVAEKASKKKAVEEEPKEESKESE